MVKKMTIGFAALTALLLVFLVNIREIGVLMNKETIDNTNHGWEVKRNSNHKQPDIPPKAMEIISRYDGVYAGDPDKNVVYLTIDLGYETGNTDVILDILKKNDVKATFFIISSYLNKNPDIVDRIVTEGHSLQNHTANYRHLDKLSDDQVKNEIMEMHKLIDSRYGIKMKYLRPPYEEWSERVLKTASGLGYKTVFWSIACVDWVEGADANYVCANVMKNYHNGAVILFHTVSKDSPRAADMMIKKLKEKGFEFKILDM